MVTGCRRLGVSLAVLALGIPAAVSAQEPLVTDRPDFTESTEVVPRGRVQAEGGYTFSRAGSEDRHAFGEVLVRVPVAERLELRFALNSYLVMRSRAGEASGFEDGLLGFKLKLLEGPEEFEVTRPAAAVVMATSVPTGASVYRETALQPEVKLALAWPVSHRLSVSSNLIAAVPREDGERFMQLAASLSAGYSLAERVAGYVEVYGFEPAERDGSSLAYVNGGLTLLLSPDHQLDVRAGRALNTANTDYFVGVGLGARW